MSRDLEILRKDEWFLGADNCQKYPIYYRYVICYSLLSYLNNVLFDKNEGLKVLQELQKAINDESYFKKKKFIELFPLKENWGFVVVDQADGIYPLIIYSEKRETELGAVTRSQRVAAFQLSLNKVIEKYDEIYDTIKQHDLSDWSKEFQENLFRAVGFEYTDSE